jgi:hypothetical protein
MGSILLVRQSIVFVHSQILVPPEKTSTRNCRSSSVPLARRSRHQCRLDDLNLLVKS